MTYHSCTLSSPSVFAAAACAYSINYNGYHYFAYIFGPPLIVIAKISIPERYSQRGALHVFIKASISSSSNVSLFFR